MRKGIVLTTLALLAARLPAGAQAPAQPAQLYDTATARDVGMGGAVTASAGDLAGVIWNPAGLAHLQTRQVVYSEALTSFPKSLRFVGYAQAPQDGPPGSLAYLHVDNRVHNTTETGVMYSFANQYTPQLSVGANMRLSRYERLGRGKEAIGFDVGALYDLLPTATLGVAVLNLTKPTIADGTTLSETQVLPAAFAPRTVNAGLLFRLNPTVDPGKLGAAKTYRTLLALDVFDATAEVRRQLRFGVEHRLTDTITARAGLLSSTPTAGMGIRLGGYTLNGGVLLGRKGHRASESMLSLTGAY